MSETRTRRFTWRLPSQAPTLEEMNAFDLAFQLVVSPDGHVKECKLFKYAGTNDKVTTSFRTYMKNLTFKPFESLKDRQLTFRDSLEIVDGP